MGGEIPIIDMQEINNEPCNKFREASEKWGCFRVINHGVPKELMAQIKSVGMDFFDRPVEIKQRNKTILPGSGYFTPSEINPVYEALGFDIYDSQSLPSFCSHLDASPHQREIFETYHEAIIKLGNDIVSKMAGVTSLDDTEYRVCPTHFRLNKYAVTQDNIGGTGIQTHTDASLVTILQDDEVFGGLEVLDPSGNLVCVDRIPDSFVVNLGDVAVPWSNGKLRTLKHRVVCKDVGTRLSIAVLVTPPFDVDIVAHPNFIEGDGPPKFIPFKYAELRKLRSSNKFNQGEVLELLRCRKLADGEQISVSPGLAA